MHIIHFSFALIPAVLPIFRWVASLTLEKSQHKNTCQWFIQIRQNNNITAMKYSQQTCAHLLWSIFYIWSHFCKFSSWMMSDNACHLWCNYTVRQYRQMHVAYNNVFRRQMGYHKFCSTSGMFVENRIDNFDARIRRLVYGFYQRLMCSGNSLVNCVMNSSAWLSSDLYRNWNKCLYVSEMVL